MIMHSLTHSNPSINDVYSSVQDSANAAISFLDSIPKLLHSMSELVSQVPPAGELLHSMSQFVSKVALNAEEAIGALAKKIDEQATSWASDIDAKMADHPHAKKGAAFSLIALGVGGIFAGAIHLEPASITLGSLVLLVGIKLAGSSKN
jgi:hypothetical protein